MKDLIRDAPIGQIIRYFTKNRVLLYPEEKADFQCPPDYANPDLIVLQQKHTQRSSSSGSAGANGLRYDTDEKKRGIEDAESGQADHYGDKDLGLPRDAPRPGVDRTRTARSALGRVATEKDLERSATLRQTISRVSTRTALQQARTREQLEEEFRASTLEKQPTTPIVPQVTSDGSILVDWYTTDDPVSIRSTLRWPEHDGLTTRRKIHTTGVNGRRPWQQAKSVSTPLQSTWARRSTLPPSRILRKYSE